nr:unnamed protein product [Callosobruchus chinensis]
MGTTKIISSGGQVTKQEALQKLSDTHTSTFLDDFDDFFIPKESKTIKTYGKVVRHLPKPSLQHTAGTTLESGEPPGKGRVGFIEQSSLSPAAKLLYLKASKL